MQAPRDLTAFIAAERPRLVAAMTLQLGDRAVAEEVVQEAFVRAAARWSRVRELDSPGGWTWRVAHNLATSTLRRRAIERRVQRRLEAQDAGRVHHDPDPIAGERVRAAVAALPERQREVVVLRHYLGHDGPAIAAITGQSHDNVRKLLQRASERLRAVLVEETRDVR